MNLSASRRSGGHDARPHRRSVDETIRRSRFARPPPTSTDQPHDRDHMGVDDWGVCRRGKYTGVMFSVCSAVEPGKSIPVACARPRISTQFRPPLSFARRRLGAPSGRGSTPQMPIPSVRVLTPKSSFGMTEARRRLSRTRASPPSILTVPL
jgi:hypothetical protein